MENKIFNSEQTGAHSTDQNGHSADKSVSPNTPRSNRPPRRRDYEAVGVQMGLTGDALKLDKTINEFKADLDYVKTKLKEISDESILSIDRLETKVKHLLKEVNDGIENLSQQKRSMIEDLKRFKSGLISEELDPALQQKYYEEFLLESIKRVGRTNDRIEERASLILTKLDELNLDSLKKEIETFKEQYIIHKTEELSENMRLTRKGFKYGDALNTQSGT